MVGRPLDLDAYLSRIGYSGPAGPSEATLAGLYRAHLAAIRFENLDVFLRGSVDVSLEAIQDKIVYRGRGGYCYEQAQLFGAVLERLGFGVERLLARVGPDGGAARPRTHMTLRVRADGGVWLADPGFGSSPPAPLSLRRYRSGGPQEVDGWVYEVVPDSEHGEEVWKLREHQAGEWVTLHRWDRRQGAARRRGAVQPLHVHASQQSVEAGASAGSDDQLLKSDVLPSGSLGSESNPHTSLHGHSGAELTRRSLSGSPQSKTATVMLARVETVCRVAE